MKDFLVPFLAAVCGFAPASHAADGIAVGMGSGSDADMAQIALTRSWTRQWFTDGDWHLSGYWEVSVSHWDPEASSGRRILDFGFAPVFRLQPKVKTGWRPYLEGAIGLHLVSRTHVDAKSDLGSAFQFGDHLGVGLTLGERGQFDLGYRFQHLSNADIKDPNHGIDFHQLRLGYLF